MSHFSEEHGLSIGLHRVNNEFYMKLVIQGRLTHEDYKIITPLLDNAVQGVHQAHIKVLIDARDFDGWDLHAAWDDLKLGLKHNKEFVKVAYVGSKEWEERLIKISNWFTCGDMQYFEDISEAMLWLEL